MLTRQTVALGVLSEILATVSCAFRSPLHRSLTYGVFVLLNLYLVFHPQTPAPDVHVGYLVFTWFAVRIFILADFHLLTPDMQKEFRRKSRGDKWSEKGVAAEEMITQAPLLRRIKWGFDLVWAIRGIAWEHGPSPAILSVHPVYHRGTFLMHRVGLLIYRLACRTVLFRAIQATGPIPPFFSRLWWLRLLLVWACVYELRLRVQMIYDTSALLSVAFNLSSSSEWPPSMGSFGDMYSVRRFWGCVFYIIQRERLLTLGTSRTWHQGLRRVGCF